MITRHVCRLAGALSFALCVMSAPALAQQGPGEPIGQQFKDATLVTKVAAQLRVERALLMERIDVAADNGVVTLSGKVSNQLSINTAVRVAQQVSGVSKVVNEMALGRRDPDGAVTTSP